MITLKTINTFSNEDILAYVFKHLYKQGRKSMEEIDGLNYCMYRGEGGLKCAAGALISDEEMKEAEKYSPYDTVNFFPGYENKTFQAVVRMFNDFNPKYKINSVKAELIGRMQEIHDNYLEDNQYFKEDLIARFAQLAVEYEVPFDAEKLIKEVN